MNKNVKFSVLMPTYNQCAFIRRAILSLMKQTYKEWELIIINDGCTDETEDYIADYLEDPRITYIKNEENTGLGHALNQGLDAAKYDYIAYLPSDDYYFENHLETIKEKFEEDNEVSFVFSGMQFDTSDTLIKPKKTECQSVRDGHCLQLVQSAHKKSIKKWVERSEYITEDLFQMYWYKILDEGIFQPTNVVTCFWTSHPFQRHNLVGERYGGGLNVLRSYYKIKNPIKIRVSKQKYVDENVLNMMFSGRVCLNKESLKILIVGELAYNPERIYALEQAGHKLYGLWVDHPDYSFCEVGPLPFGHVEDVSNDNWEKEIKRIKPDIIYGLLNSGAVNKVYQVVKSFPDIPYVWHMKEGPFLSLRIASWDKVIYLYRHASGRIFINETIKDWYNLFLPPSVTPSIILDGDLPKVDYFNNDFTSKISDEDGEIHTLVAGRMIGLSQSGFQTLAEHKIHIHLYNENYLELNTRNNRIFQYMSQEYFHVHSHVDPGQWVKEFSRYDAGWLHCFESKNEGNLMRATWDDLNIPARLSTYAAAGLPCIISKNDGHVVAAKEIVLANDIGILFNDYQELAYELEKEKKKRRLTRNMLSCRMQFSFDYHVSQLIELFNQAIVYKNGKQGTESFA